MHGSKVLVGSILTLASDSWRQDENTTLPRRGAEFLKTLEGNFLIDNGEMPTWLILLPIIYTLVRRTTWDGEA